MKRLTADDPDLLRNWDSECGRSLEDGKLCEDLTHSEFRIP